MTVTGTIIQASRNGQYLTDCSAGDVLLMSLSNNSWFFGAGSNNSSIMKINSNNVNINASAVTAFGYVGINTPTPQYALDVNGDVNFSGVLNSAGVRFYSSPWMSNSSNAYITSGLVGIGTSAPSYNLHVAGTAAANSLTTTNIYTPGTTPSNTLNIGTDSNTSTINIGNNNTSVNLFGSFEYVNATNLAISDSAITLNNGGASGTSGGAGILINEGSNTVSYVKLSSDRNSFLFKTPVNSNVLNINLSNNGVNINGGAFVINSNNYVGIGRPSPNYNLDVAGVVNASNILINGTSLYTDFWLSAGNANYTYSNVAIGSNATPNGTLFYVANALTTQTGTGDFTNATSNIVTFYDPNYSRIAHKSGSSTISTVYNYESNKNVFWGEAADTGYFSFRGRNVCVGYPSTATGGYALDVNGTVNCGDKLYATNNFSLGTTNLSEKLTIASGNIAVVTGGTYGNATSADQWMSLGTKTQTAAPQYQQSNYGINATWASHGCYFGLKDYGARKDTIVAYAGSSNPNLRFQYNNSNDTMTLTSSGSVGIGTSNPQYKLDVAGSVNVGGMLYQNGSTQIGIGTTIPAYQLDVNGNANIRGMLYQNGSTQIGIGTTAPSYQLDVVGSINYSGSMYNNRAPVAMWAASNGSLFVQGSNVGINTTSPTCSLTVCGDVLFNSNIYLGKTLQMPGLKIGMSSNGGVQNVASTITSILGFTYCNGNVGILNTNPQYGLDVIGTGHFTSTINADTVVSFSNNTQYNTPQTGTNGGSGDRLVLSKGATGAYPLSMGVSSNAMWYSTPSNIQHTWYIGGSPAMTLSNAGSNAALVLTGDIAAFGSVSDARLKSNVVGLAHASCLDTVSRLRPVEFDWNSNCFNDDYKGTHDFGLIAQEVAEVLPEATKDCDFVGETYKTIKYERLVPFLIGAIKELQQQNAVLADRLDLLERLGCT